MTTESHSWTKKDIEDYRGGVLTATGLSTSYESHVNKEWNKFRNEIIGFVSLQEDWDEMGGVPPSPELINGALNIFSREERLKRFPPPVRVVPTNEGGIIIEWQFDGCYLEAEICEPFCAEWMYAEPGRPIEHWEETWGTVEIQGTASTITGVAA